MNMLLFLQVFTKATMKLFCGAAVVFCVGVVPSLGRNHYNDYYDDNDYFTETGFVLTPTDRQARDILHTYWTHADKMTHRLVSSLCLDRSC